MVDAARRRRWDEHLDAAVADLLAHDSRVRDLSVIARADGGVVHLTGDVADPGQLAVLRRLIGRLAGVHGVWDRVRIAGREPVVLDLGCGGYKQYPTNIGVDRRRTPAVAVEADLTAPLPFADAAIDRIFLVHVLEHLVDYLPLVDECHRVLTQGGMLHVLSPWWRHVNAVAGNSFVLSAYGSNFGSMFIILKPFSERRSSGMHADVIIV